MDYRKMADKVSESENKGSKFWFIRRCFKMWMKIFMALAVIILAYFSITAFFSPSSPPHPPAECKGFAKIRPMDWMLNTEGELKLMLFNEAPARLRITAQGVTAYIEGGGKCTNLNPPTEQYMTPGSKLQVNIAGCPTNNLEKEDFYRAYINISYTDTGTGMRRKSTGTCWADVE